MSTTATVLWVGEVSKLTLGKPLDVLTLHQVQAVLEVKGYKRLTRGSLIRYQALLMDTV